MDTIMDVLTKDEIARLQEIYHDGRVRLWGTRFKKIWVSMNIADCVLFYQKNRVIALAEVAFKTVNDALAVKLWGKHESGKTWKNIFFVKNNRKLNIHRKVLNRIAGYDESFVPQGFMRTRNEASQRILNEITCTKPSQNESSRRAN